MKPNCDRCKNDPSYYNAMLEICNPCIFEREICNLCSIFEREEAKPKKMTNADRIRSMTDEELADEILRWFNWLNAVEWDDKRIINWLKQEADG